MGRGQNIFGRGSIPGIPWIGVKIPCVGSQNTFDRGVKIPWVEVEIPWIGDHNTMDRGLKYNG